MGTPDSYYLVPDLFDYIYLVWWKYLPGIGKIELHSDLVDFFLAAIHRWLMFSNGG